jgi:hypothetical protein
MRDRGILLMGKSLASRTLLIVCLLIGGVERLKCNGFLWIPSSGCPQLHTHTLPASFLCLRGVRREAIFFTRMAGDNSGKATIKEEENSRTIIFFFARHLAAQMTSRETSRELQRSLAAHALVINKQQINGQKPFQYSIHSSSTQNIK